MPAGLQAINDSGVFQIDDTYRNMQLVSKTSVTAMTQVSYGGSYDGIVNYWYKDIVVTDAVNPVIALNGNTTQWLIIGAVNISGSTWTFRVFSDADVDFTYYVFDVYQGTPPTSGVGLEVYNSAGQLQYTSARFPLRAVQQVVTSSLDATKTTTLSSGPTYAIVTQRPGLVSSGFYTLPDPCASPPISAECAQQNYCGGFKLNGVTLSTNAGAFQWFDQYRSSSYECGFFVGDELQRVLVIDVTNM